jgi:hypothetical protein
MMGFKKRKTIGKKHGGKRKLVLSYTRLVAFVLIEPHSLMGQQGF